MLIVSVSPMLFIVAIKAYKFDIVRIKGNVRVIDILLSKNYPVVPNQLGRIYNNPVAPLALRPTLQYKIKPKVYPRLGGI
jgi:hypothetical protein